jgi:hypothetical protein
VKRRAVLGSVAAGLAGCLGDGTGTRTTRPDRTPRPADPAAEFWHTRPQASGNRYLAGASDLAKAEPVTFDPPGTPRWLVAHPAERGSHWTVVADDGTATLYRVADGDATRERTYDPLPAETPPVVAATESGSGLLRPPSGMATQSVPTVVPGEESTAPKTLYLAENGDLVVAGETVERLPVDGLPDGRIVAVGDGTYALYGGGTGRYTHGALGDTTEGSELTVFDPEGPATVGAATLDPPQAFEGLSPLVADVDGDGDPEVVTTVADSSRGARIAVFDPSGERVATGPVHEPGWRHQLAVAPLGPGGEVELAVVRKPHVERLLELYRLEGGTLSVVGTLSGFSTHTYGSRVTDGAVAGDLDDDGATELLLPTAQRTELAAVRHERDGPSVAWQWSLPTRVQTNVTGVPTGTGLAVGVGTGDEVRVWQG